jgi:cyclopropane fatty-acyl-phospholipid synthase-like methyltransferase
MDRRKALVRDGYDTIAEAYARERPKRRRDYPADCQREQAWLARFFDLLPGGGRILDLGCGNGEPILVELVTRGFRVTGVDFSHEQVIRARRRCPDATVLEQDMAEVDFERAFFDGVVSYDAIWHIPRQEHATLFARIRRWLVDGAPALLTLAAADTVTPEDRGSFTDLLGAPTFYDAWPVEVSLELLRAAGFTILDSHCHPIPTRGHLIVLARATITK